MNKMFTSILSYTLTHKRFMCSNALTHVDTLTLSVSVLNCVYVHVNTHS